MNHPVHTIAPHEGALFFDDMGICWQYLHVLAIVKTVAEKHGARVLLGQSTKHGGMRVEVRFPGTAAP